MAVAGAGSIELWEVGATRANEFAIDGDTHEVWFSPDGRWLAVATETEVLVIDTEARKEVVRWPPDEVPSDIVFSPDSRLLAASLQTKITLLRLEDRSRGLLWTNSGRSREGLHLISLGDSSLCQ